jgi:hypothetical protein
MSTFEMVRGRLELGTAHRNPVARGRRTASGYPAKSLESRPTPTRAVWRIQTWRRPWSVGCPDLRCAHPAEGVPVAAWRPPGLAPARRGARPAWRPPGVAPARPGGRPASNVGVVAFWVPMERRPLRSPAWRDGAYVRGREQRARCECPPGIWVVATVVSAGELDHSRRGGAVVHNAGAPAAGDPRDHVQSVP